MRLKARTDHNQREIVKAFRDAGAIVQHTHQLSHGVADLAIGFAGIMKWVEVKDGEKSKSKRKLTTDETGWHKLWKGYVVTVESLNDVQNLLKELATKAQTNKQ